MGESVIRSGRKQQFTVLYNSMLRDRRLSLKAKGLFAIMASLPEDWQFSISGLATYTGYGKDVIRAALVELKKAGYLLQEQSHGESGRFASSVYVLQDEAPCAENPTTVAPCADLPFTAKPSTDLPFAANPTQQNKDLTKERLTNTPKVPNEVYDAIDRYIGDDPEYRAAFDGFLANRIAMRKPVKTARAINTIINRLRMVNDREVEIAMLDKATERNWQTVYKLRPDELPARPAPEGRAYGWE